MVGGADCIGGHQFVGGAEAGQHSGGHLLQRRESVFSMPGRKSFLALGPPVAIDAAGRAVGAVELDLNSQQIIDGNRGWCWHRRRGTNQRGGRGEGMGREWARGLGWGRRHWHMHTADEKQ